MGESDPARLRQILVNLVGNAARFTEDGDIRVTGRLVRPAVLRLEVKDDGVGIAAERLPGLFDPFTQGAGPLSTGAGLGLALVKQLAELLGGSVGVESALGEGSTFWVELPWAAASQAWEPAAAGGPLASPLRVLVAEDDSVNQVVLEGLLRRAGHSVVMVTDGRSAVERASADRFDVILMDACMPELDGIEATRALRLGGCQLPIIALTGAATTETRQRCLDAGMDAFLTKPIDWKRLEELLSEVQRAAAA